MVIEMFEIINYSLQLTWIVLQLIIAFSLSFKMIQTKRYNLIPLILFFIINSIRFIFFVMIPSLILINLILIQFPNILLVIFIKLTFHRHKKSGFKIILISLIIIRTIDCIIRLNFRISVPMSYLLDESLLIYYYYILFSITASFLCSHLWLGLVALRYYTSIKDVNIEPWIKKRYQILGLTSIFYSFTIFIYYLVPYNVIGVFAYPNIILMYIILGVTLFYSIGMFLGWVMPRRLKKYFNKDFSDIAEKEYSEDELMELIKKELDDKGSMTNVI